jgi:predicted Zn-dependent peptidase
MRFKGTKKPAQRSGRNLLWADIQPGHNVEELESALDRALVNLDGPGLPALVERARNQLLLQVYRQMEDNNSLASFMGEFIATANDPIFAFDLLKRVSTVTPEDVLRVVSKYFIPSNRTTVVGRPQS